jgi:hypothetical protein
VRANTKFDRLNYPRYLNFVSANQKSSARKPVNKSFSYYLAPILFFGVISIFVLSVFLSGQSDAKDAQILLSQKEEIVKFISDYDQYFIETYAGGGTNVLNLREDLNNARDDLNKKKNDLIRTPTDGYSVDLRVKLTEEIDAKIEYFDRNLLQIDSLETLTKVRPLLKDSKPAEDTLEKLNDIFKAYQAVIKFQTDISPEDENTLERLKKELLAVGKSLDELNKQAKTDFESQTKTLEKLREVYKNENGAESFPAENLRGLKITPASIGANEFSGQIFALDKAATEVRLKYGL